MNTTLWVLQILLALHTAAGAFWKLSNTAEQAVPSLKAIPPGVWTSLSVIELFCAAGLIVASFSKPLAKLAPLAAIFVAVEMVAFCGVSLASGTGSAGEVTYWMVVAAFCAFIAYGRLTVKPA